MDIKKQVWYKMKNPVISGCPVMIQLYCILLDWSCCYFNLKCIHCPVILYLLWAMNCSDQNKKK